MGLPPLPCGRFPFAALGLRPVGTGRKPPRAKGQREALAHAERYMSPEGHPAYPRGNRQGWGTANMYILPGGRVAEARMQTGHRPTLGPMVRPVFGKRMAATPASATSIATPSERFQPTWQGYRAQEHLPRGTLRRASSYVGGVRCSGRRRAGMSRVVERTTRHANHATNCHNRLVPLPDVAALIERAVGAGRVLELACDRGVVRLSRSGRALP